MNSIVSLGRRRLVNGFLLHREVIPYRGFSIATAQTDEGQKIQQYFQSQFLGPDEASISEINSACFQRVSQDKVKKLLPEIQFKDNGSSGDNSSNYWMIRDSSKTLCHLLDHSRQFLSPSIETVERKAPSNALPPIDIPRFSNGKEWSVAQPRYYRYGKDLTKTTESSDSSALNSSIIESEFNENFPDKIVITGNRIHLESPDRH